MLNHIKELTIVFENVDGLVLKAEEIEQFEIKGLSYMFYSKDGELSPYASISAFFLELNDKANHDFPSNYKDIYDESVDKNNPYSSMNILTRLQGKDIVSIELVDNNNETLEFFVDWEDATNWVYNSAAFSISKEDVFGNYRFITGSKEEEWPNHLYYLDY